MVAKFLDDQPKKCIHTISNSINLIQFHLMLAFFYGVESKRTAHLSLDKENENFSVVVTHSLGVKIGSFVSQSFNDGKENINVQESMMHVQSYCFGNLNLLLLCCSCCRHRCRCLSSPLL